MTDAQWEVLRPEAEEVMAGLRLAEGRPMVHDLRATIDAIGYVVRNGETSAGAPVRDAYGTSARPCQRSPTPTIRPRQRDRAYAVIAYASLPNAFASTNSPAVSSS